eukprot:Rhum_TRINITY_DN8608_c0_g1::Rhum_TRINITY_DN8608_c0_g1_i1::g.28972::m.28972
MLDALTGLAGKTARRYPLASVLAVCVFVAYAATSARELSLAHPAPPQPPAVPQAQVPVRKGTVWDPVPKDTKRVVKRPRPSRLRRYSQSVVNTANDWHFSMMNDVARNDAFRAALQAATAAAQGGAVVLDVGSGAGLLSLVAASLGARKVYALEANKELADVSRALVRRNKAAGIVEVRHSMSTECAADDFQPRPNVLVSETLGTFLLGESALFYMSDARDRLLAPGGTVIPAGGAQYVSVVHSKRLRDVSRVGRYEGLDLRPFNALVDTSSIVFTKQYGFVLRGSGVVDASPPLLIYDVDFHTDTAVRVAPDERVVLRFESQCDCTLDALVFHWTAWMDRDRRLNISTHHNAALDADSASGRDAAWGQAVQLLMLEAGEEDEDGGSVPTPLVASRGEVFEVVLTGTRNVLTLSGTVRRV